jgi:hypothetical protein
MLRVMRLFVSTSLLVLAMTLPSSAQTGLATVTGLVTDNSGARARRHRYGDESGHQRRLHRHQQRAGVPGSRACRRGTLLSSGPTGFKSVQSNVALSVSQTARVDFNRSRHRRREGRGRGHRRAPADRERQSPARRRSEQVEKPPIQGRNRRPRRLRRRHHAESSFNDLEEHGRRSSLRQRTARAATTSC